MFWQLGYMFRPSSFRTAFRKSALYLFPRVLSFGALSGSVAWLSSQDGIKINAEFPSPLLPEIFSKSWQIVEEFSETDSPVENSRSQFSAVSSLSPISSTNKSPCLGGDSAKFPGCLSRDSVANAAAAVGSAVVTLSVTEVNGIFSGKSIGSGTIIDSDGTILTCAHVVADFHRGKSIAKGKVTVTLQDGRSFMGVLVNADHHSDIAFVKINSKTPLPVAKLGTSSTLRPGEWVVAVGGPFLLQNTVTAGIVSSVDRKNSDLGLGGLRREYIQTDCAINEGNSGGPLVNLDGEVVGVNVMKIRNADGLNFAVPIDSVTKIIHQLKNNGRVVRPWLGLKMLDLNELIITELRERDPAFPDVTEGILVPMLTPGSPAERAGFRPGDIVIQFAGRPVKSVSEIAEIIENNVGEPLKVLVRRGSNQTSLLTVVPEEANFDM